MTCTHFNKAKDKISILTTLVRSKGIHEEMGPYLTPSQVRKFMEGRLFNPNEEQVESAGKNIRVVNELSLEEKLEEIYDLLAECDCHKKEEKLRIKIEKEKR